MLEFPRAFLENAGGARVTSGPMPSPGRSTIFFFNFIVGSPF